MESNYGQPSLLFYFLIISSLKQDIYHNTLGDDQLFLQPFFKKTRQLFDQK